MKLENKAMLFKVDFSITSGRKVDKEVSSKIADDYNVSGGSQASGNFNKITIAQKYIKPFQDIKRRVEQAVKQNTLPYLHDSDNTYLLPNNRIMNISKIWRDAEREWETAKDELVDGKYHEALQEAKKRLNDSGGMFRYDDYPDVEDFVAKFKMKKFLRPVPSAHGLEMLTGLSEIEAKRIKDEVEQSMNESLESSVESLYNKIKDEMNGLISVLDKDNPRICETRVDGLNHLIRIIDCLNFTNDDKLKDIQQYMKDNLLFVPASLRGNKPAQTRAINHARKVLQMIFVNDVADNQEEPLTAMEKLYGFGS